MTTFHKVPLVSEQHHGPLLQHPWKHLDYQAAGERNQPSWLLPLFPPFTRLRKKRQRQLSQCRASHLHESLLPSSVPVSQT